MHDFSEKSSLVSRTAPLSASRIVYLASPIHGGWALSLIVNESLTLSPSCFAFPWVKVISGAAPSALMMPALLSAVPAAPATPTVGVYRMLNVCVPGEIPPVNGSRYWQTAPASVTEQELKFF